ncbi:MAG TPA: hypothetical protein VGB13_01785 [Candidatus Krumholzibacteria bacterium]
MSNAVLANFVSLIADAEQLFGDEADLADVFTGYDVNLGELRALVRAANAHPALVDALRKIAAGAWKPEKIARAALASLTDGATDGA